MSDDRSSRTIYGLLMAYGVATIVVLYWFTEAFRF